MIWSISNPHCLKEFIFPAAVDYLPSVLESIQYLLEAKILISFNTLPPFQGTGGLNGVRFMSIYTQRPWKYPWRSSGNSKISGYKSKMKSYLGTLDINPRFEHKFNGFCFSNQPLGTPVFFRRINTPIINTLIL